MKYSNVKLFSLYQFVASEERGTKRSLFVKIINSNRLPVDLWRFHLIVARSYLQRKEKRDGWLLPVSHPFSVVSSHSWSGHYRSHTQTGPFVAYPPSQVFYQQPSHGSEIEVFVIMLAWNSIDFHINQQWIISEAVYHIFPLESHKVSNGAEMAPKLLS